jgi:hypothetical protein
VKWIVRRRSNALASYSFRKSASSVAVYAYRSEIECQCIAGDAFNWGFRRVAEDAPCEAGWCGCGLIV